MVHFFKFTFPNGAVSYMNLDMIVDVDVEKRKVTFVGGVVMTFDDESDPDWRMVMKFVRKYEVR